MVKKSKTVYILGSIIIALTSLFLIYFLLAVTGVIMVQEETLIIASDSIEATYTGEEIKCEEIVVLSGELNKDHKIEATFTGKQVNVGTTNNTYTFKIVDSLGVDVTDKYNVQKEEGSITVTKRPITISPINTSLTKTYDGEPLAETVNECIIQSGTLVAGHTISVKPIGSQTDVGNGETRLSYHILDENQVDVTGNYDVSQIPGSLVVTPIKLTIASASETKFYDGKEFVVDDCWIDKGNLLDYDKDGKPDHKLVAKTTANPTDPGEHKNEFNYDIIDIKTNESVKDNYEVLPSYGTLTITTEKMVFKTYDLTRDYTGKEISISSLDEKPDEKTIEILEKYNFEYKVIFEEVKKTDVGEYDLRYDVQIYNKDGEQVTKFCHIDQDDVSLVIIPKIATIETPDHKFVYNGEFDQCTDEGYLFSGILPDHKVEYEVPKYTIEEFLNANNGLKNEPIKLEVIDKETGKKVTDNYEFDDEKIGDVIIELAKIQLISSDKEKNYDKQELVFEELKLIYGQENVSNDPSNPQDSYKLKFMKDHYVEISFLKTDEDNKFINVGERENKFTYKIYDANDLEVTSLFAVGVEYGTLEIKPVEIEVETPSYSKVYDGKKITIPTNEIAEYVLKNCSESDLEQWGIELNITERTEVTYPSEGIVENVLTFEIKDIETGEINENYIIKQKCGELEVKTFYIRLSTPNVQFEREKAEDIQDLTYTGKLKGMTIYEADTEEVFKNKDKAFRNGNLELNGTEYQLQNGYKLIISDTWTEISLGYIVNRPLNYFIQDPNGEQVQIYIFPNVPKKEEKLVDFVIYEDFNYLNVYNPSYDVVIKPFPVLVRKTIVDADGGISVGSAYSKNYIPSDISYSGDRILDVLPYLNSGKYEVEIGMKNSNNQEVTTAYEPGIYSTYIKSFKIILPDSASEAEKAKIESIRIGIESSSLQVYLYTLDLYSASKSKQYDGEGLKVFSDGAYAENYQFGHTVVFEETNKEIVKVGSIYNELNYKIIDSNGNDVTGLYKANKHWGELKITPINANIRLFITEMFIPEDKTIITINDFAETSWEVEGLLFGHKITYFESEEILGVGPVVLITFKVEDGDGNDVTNLYEFNSVAIDVKYS